MKRAQVIGLGLAALLAFAACESGKDDGGDTTTKDNQQQTLTGTWTGSGQYRQGTPIYSMMLYLTQTGNHLEGTYTVDRAGRSNMRGRISGYLEGAYIRMDYIPHGNASGTVSGNSMLLDWYESGFGGHGEYGTVSLRHY
jgi:hypothetical protein